LSVTVDIAVSSAMSVPVSASCWQARDNTIFIDHVATNSTSYQLYNGVLGGYGHRVFNGQIMVRHGADGTGSNRAQQ